MTHLIRAIHERNDDQPAPLAFVAEVACTCNRLFKSDVHSDAPAARTEAREAFDAHVAEEVTAND